MHARPLVSVVMPVYNRPEYVRLAIESILIQSLGGFELIVVNDGSDEVTSRLLRALARNDARIRLIEQTNSGIVVSRNRGFSASIGDYIAIFDSDDICMPDRLALEVDYLRSHSEVVAVGGWAYAIDEDGVRLYEISCPTSHREIMEQLLEVKEFRAPLIQPSTMIRRHAFEKVGGYRQGFEPAEDRDLWLRLGQIGQLANVNQFVLSYRVHCASATHGNRRVQAQRSRKAVNLMRRQLGIEPLPEIGDEVVRATPEDELRFQVAKRALAQGYFVAGLKHGIKSLRGKQAAPRVLRLLKLALRSLAGKGSRIL